MSEDLEHVEVQWSKDEAYIDFGGPVFRDRLAISISVTDEDQREVMQFLEM